MIFGENICTPALPAILTSQLIPKTSLPSSVLIIVKLILSLNRVIEKAKKKQKEGRTWQSQKVDISNIIQVN